MGNVSAAQRRAWLHRPDESGVYPKDRRCPVPGCITRLCIWNPGPECYLHAPARPESNDLHIDVLAELMEAA